MYFLVNTILSCFLAFGVSILYRICTATEDYRVEVSKRIKEDYGNGRECYEMYGQKLIILPQSKPELPSKEYIQCIRLIVTILLSPFPPVLAKELFCYRQRITSKHPLIFFVKLLIIVGREVPAQAITPFHSGGQRCPRKVGRADEDLALALVW